MATTERRLLTPDQIADELQLRRRTVVIGELRRCLPWIKIAGRLRVEESAFRAFLAARRGAA